jgi:RNA methyltransferase, TrmH family
VSGRLRVPEESQRRRRAGAGARLHQRALVRVCGLAAVGALIERDPGRVERLYFEPRLGGEAGRFCAALAHAHKPYREVDAQELARIAGTVLHGGITAIARPRPLAAFEAAMPSGWAQDKKPLLVLDGVGNPHNLGAIARTAAFFGIERILLADRPDQALPSDASYRVAEGGLEHVVLYQAPLPQALTGLRRTYRILGAALGCFPASPRGKDARPPALILGSEERGLDPATLAACEELVTIPGAGRMQSLNVAAAAAILIYQMTREPG